MEYAERYKLQAYYEMTWETPSDELADAVENLLAELKTLHTTLSFYEPPEGFGWDSQHPRYTIEDWMDYLRRGNGRPGYWEWVNYNIEEEDE